MQMRRRAQELETKKQKYVLSFKPTIQIAPLTEVTLKITLMA
jgi:hypothetical protein